MIFYPKYVEQGKNWAYRDGGFLSSESSKIQKFNEVADYVAKSGSKSKMHGPELLLQSRMPVVLARLRTDPQIDGNLGGINRKTA